LYFILLEKKKKKIAEKKKKENARKEERGYCKKKGKTRGGTRRPDRGERFYPFSRAPTASVEVFGARERMGKKGERAFQELPVACLKSLR